MATFFDPTLSTNKDRVRFYVGDTVEGRPIRPEDENPNILNETIESLLTLNNQKIFKTALDIVDSLIGEWTPYIGSAKERNYSIDNKPVVEALLERRKRLEDQVDEENNNANTVTTGTVLLKRFAG